MEQKIVHISDLHFGPPYLSHIGESAIATAKRLNPSVIAITGDFTQRAKREQFQQAREFIQRLKEFCPHVLTVPGNHDIPLYRVWSRLFSPYTLYKEFLSKKLDLFVTIENLSFACLNSTSPYLRLKEGRISKHQIEACGDFFNSQSDSTPRIVLMHHHVFPVPSFERRSVLNNAKAIVDAFTSLKVDAVLSGHIHRGYVGNTLDVYSGVNREAGVLAISCGTTTSRRGRDTEREKNSLNLITIESDAICVAHHMYFSDVNDFKQTSEHRFPRATNITKEA